MDVEEADSASGGDPGSMTSERPSPSLLLLFHGSVLKLDEQQQEHHRKTGSAWLAGGKPTSLSLRMQRISTTKV